MNKIKPAKLNKGATIGFLSVSGAIEDCNKIELAKKYFENKGYQVKISDTTYLNKDYLAGDDSSRLEALHSFFKDSEIDAIFCTRGGYGVIRFLEQIDFDLIKKNPKIFCGYSDITALLNAFCLKSGLVCWHAPMTYSDFGEQAVSTITENSMFSALSGEIFSIKLNGKIYSEGCAKGVLLGGNLATLASMVGTNIEPNEPFILFLEDINEPVYKIDRYVTQLLYSNLFRQNLKGIVLGDFNGIDDVTYFDNFFKKLGKNLSVPIISGMPVGHIRDKITVPVGINVSLDTLNRILFEY